VSGNQPKDVWLSISAVREATGLSERQLRYAERAGLISAGRSKGGQRRYTLDDVALLKRIAALRRQGRSLRHIGILFAGVRPSEEAAKAPGQPTLSEFTDAQVYFGVNPPDSRGGR
jgi:DNA-binding transcriptional MerR regulator